MIDLFKSKCWLQSCTWIFTILIMCSSAWEAEADYIDAEPDYTIGPGDVLEISIWKDKALTKVVVVLPDGKIQFPLIGQLRAAGKTVSQLKDEIEAKISRYVPNPVLSLIVQKVNSMKIYIIGRVHRAGHFMLEANTNVMQALSMAGGLNPYAKRNKIRIFRKGENSTKIFNFEYDKVSKGEKIEQNILLKRGDVIVVP